MRYNSSLSQYHKLHSYTFLMINVFFISSTFECVSVVRRKESRFDFNVLELFLFPPFSPLPTKHKKKKPLFSNKLNFYFLSRSEFFSMRNLWNIAQVYKHLGLVYEILMAKKNKLFFGK